MVVRSGRRKAGRAPRGEPGGRGLAARDSLLEEVDGLGRPWHGFTNSSKPAGRLPTKAWYTTGDLAEALGVTQYTVQVRWCAAGRIECEKDPDTGRWRIPATEYDRLVRGGSSRASRKRR